MKININTLELQREERVASNGDIREKHRAKQEQKIT